MMPPSSPPSAAPCPTSASDPRRRRVWALCCAGVWVYALGLSTAAGIGPKVQEGF